MRVRTVILRVEIHSYESGVQIREAGFQRAWRWRPSAPPPRAQPQARGACSVPPKRNAAHVRGAGGGRCGSAARVHGWGAAVLPWQWRRGPPPQRRRHHTRRCGRGLRRRRWRCGEKATAESSAGGGAPANNPLVTENSAMQLYVEPPGDKVVAAARVIDEI
jgi:hypothetical protein